MASNNLMLSVTSMDSNKLRKHTKIGEGSVKLPSNLMNLTDSCTLSVSIQDTKNKPVGMVEITLMSLQQAAPITPASTNSVNPTAAPTNSKTPEIVAAAAPDVTKKPIDAPNVAASPAIPPFRSGTLSVKKIKLENIKNVEYFGKNDLFCRVMFGSNLFTTQTLNEAGAMGLFDYLDMKASVDSDIFTETMTIEVWDANTITSNVLIGQCVLPLAILRPGIEKDYVLDVCDAKKVSVGRAIVHLQLDSATPLSDNTTATSTVSNIFQSKQITNCQLQINAIQGVGLKYTDSYFNSKVDSPYFKISYGQYALNSKHLVSSFDNGNGVVRNIGVSIDVTEHVLTSTPLSIEVWDKNSVTSDAYIGAGSSVFTVIGNEYNIAHDMSIDIVNKAKGLVGKLIIHYTFIEKMSGIAIPDAATLIARYQQNTTGFVLNVTTISVQNLLNTELMGNQDPYVTLQHKSTPDWSYKSSTKSGSNPIWEGVDCKLHIPTINQVVQEAVEISVFDDNSLRSDTHVGSALLQLSLAAVTLNKMVTINADLLHNKTKKSVGKVAITCSLIEYVKPPDVAVVASTIPASFNGYVAIKRIVGTGLKNSNMVSDLTSYAHVALTVPANKKPLWTEQTNSVEGTSPSWESLALTPSVTTNDVKEGSLVITVYNDSLVDSVIGTATIALLSLTANGIDKDLEVSGELVDKKGVKTGKIMLLTRLCEGKPEVITQATVETIIEKTVDIKFTSAMLMVHKMKAFGLKNTELFGDIDPFITLQHGDWNYKTSVLTNAGSNIIWDNLGESTVVTKDSILANDVLVSVYDANRLRGHTLLGTGKLSLKRPASKLNKEMEVSVVLTGSNGQSLGRVDVTLEVRDIVVTKSKLLPEGFKNGVLHIVRLKTFDLTNTGTHYIHIPMHLSLTICLVELIGQQDPYLKVKIGSLFNDKTHTIDNGGGEVLYDYLDMKCLVTESDFNSQRLEIEAWDDNVMMDTLIGTGSIALSEAITSKYNEEVEVSVQLRSKSDKPAGRIVATIRIEEPPPVKDIEIMIPESFVSGEFRLSRIVGVGLPQADILTKSDPYVTVKLPDGTTYTTNTLMNSGSTGIWDALDCSCAITRQNLIDGVIDVTVKDKGFIGDSSLAVGSVAIKRVGIKPGNEIELSIDLKSPKNGNTKGCGRLILYCSVIDAALVAKEKLDETFQFGQLNITKIRTFNLKNTEWLGKQVRSHYFYHFIIFYTLISLEIGSLLQVTTGFVGGQDPHH